jgi:hypothetical protein
MTPTLDEFCPLCATRLLDCISSILSCWLYRSKTIKQDYRFHWLGTLVCPVSCPLDEHKSAGGGKSGTSTATHFQGLRQTS